MSNPLRPGKGNSSSLSRFAVVKYTLKDLIEFAYVVHARQIEGGPAWIDKDPWDFSAMLPSPRPKRDQMPRMMQKALALRFGLKLHTEKREMPVYTLVVADGGPKMAERKAGDGGSAASSIGLPAAPHIPAKNVPILRLTALLQTSVLDRPVIDQTGLTGSYDFDLHWQADAHQFGGRGGEGSWHGNAKDPDLFKAIQEQLGLKLQPQTLPVDILLIDSATRPDAKK